MCVWSSNVSETAAASKTVVILLPSLALFSVSFFPSSCQPSPRSPCLLGISPEERELQLPVSHGYEMDPGKGREAAGSDCVSGYLTVHAAQSLCSV